MPAIVKTFIESLAPLRARASNPPLAFLIQGGFPEATHSRYVERYLERLAYRLGSPYLGTIVKGGCEMRRDPSAVHRVVYDALFANWGVSRSLEALGRSLAAGHLDRGQLHRLARLERYPRVLVPLLRVSGGNPLVNHYWDVLLKRAGAYERRDATPFATTDIVRS